MADCTNADTNAWAQARRTEALVNDLPTVLELNQPNKLRARLVALETKLDALVAAFTSLASAIADAGGDVDVAAILAGVDERLATLAVEQRDAVADLGEGGAAQVRADA